MTKISTTDREFEESVRGWAKVLSLWRLCGNTACRRARLCRGASVACFKQNYPLLPEGTRAWFEGLGKAQEQGLSFDEAMEWLDAHGVVEEFTNWCEAVEGSVAPPAR